MPQAAQPTAHGPALHSYADLFAALNKTPRRSVRRPCYNSNSLLSCRRRCNCSGSGSFKKLNCREWDVPQQPQQRTTVGRTTVTAPNLKVSAYLRIHYSMNAHANPPNEAPGGDLHGWYHCDFQLAVTRKSRPCRGTFAPANQADRCMNL